MRFPDKLNVQLVKRNGEKLHLENVVFVIKLKAPQKNDYYLGPFFSNKGGECKISEKVLKISAEAVIQSGLMDYVNYELCSGIATIQILTVDEIEKMLKARSVWGIIGKEAELYVSKEHLLGWLKKSANHSVISKPIQVDLTKPPSSIELVINNVS